MENSADLNTFLRRLQQTLKVIVGRRCCAGNSLSEYQILDLLSTAPQSFFNRDGLYEPLALFRAHFCLFHCLYLLREEFLTSRTGFLEISALQVTLLPLATDLPSQDGSVQCCDPLETYYRDLDHLHRTGEEDVQQMLDSFWCRFAQPAGRKGALEILGCSPDDSPETVTMAYRRLAARHHPDRGGKECDFIAIRQAYESL